MTFKDYFSRQSVDYARFRPRYPDELLRFLSDLVDNRQAAWDCATGNGQVATALARYFEKVSASDASQAQIANAEENDRVEYFLSVAESTPLPSGSIDLITVAQAFHWFDADRFFSEATRVLKPGGILALWCYEFFHLPNADETLRAVLQQFYEEIEPFWPPERHLVNTGYRSIAFPFAEIATPPLAMSIEWTAEQVIGYLSTWSAFQRYLDHHGETEIQQFLDPLEQHWGDRQQVYWPISLRVGRNLRG
jgi:ubiquinone/menaquinone biosynthesis C-methylase UbiE